MQHRPALPGAGREVLCDGRPPRGEHRQQEHVGRMREQRHGGGEDIIPGMAAVGAGPGGLAGRRAGKGLGRRQWKG